MHKWPQSISKDYLNDAKRNYPQEAFNELLFKASWKHGHLVGSLWDKSCGSVLQHLGSLWISASTPGICSSVVFLENKLCIIL